MQSLGKYPAVRKRRMRRHDFSRRLMRENTLGADDLIYPAFVIDGQSKSQPIPSMPGIHRHSIDKLLHQAERCVELGIPVLAIFPAIEARLKTADARESFNPKGVIPRAVRAVKKRFPDLGVMTDVALDPYTSHGQDGLVDASGYIVNDTTIQVLGRQAVLQPPPAGGTGPPPPPVRGG